MPGFNLTRSASLSDVGDVNRVHRWSIRQIIGKSLVSRVYAAELSLPNFTMEEEILNGASIDYKIPKKAVYNDITVKFYDTFGIVATLEALRAKAHTWENGLARADAYMGETVLEMHDGYGNTTYAYRLINSYMKELSHSDLTYSNTDVKLVSVVIGYTYAKFEQMVPDTAPLLPGLISNLTLPYIFPRTNEGPALPGLVANLTPDNTPLIYSRTTDGPALPGLVSNLTPP